MTPETVAILAVGAALAGMIFHTNRETGRAMARGRRDMSREISGLRGDLAALRRRMARLEGLVREFTERKPPLAANGAAPGSAA